MKEWKTKFKYIHPLTLSVNFSIHQFRQPNLLEQISSILNEVEIDGRHFKIELTESAIMNTIGPELGIIQGLKDLGIRLSIDDFGTGYSSLSRLHELPIDTVKIDKSFVQFMDKNDSIIVRTIVTLAHTLNMSVVAEGVENLIQLKQLASMRCEMGQGYLFSRAVDSHVATRIVAMNLLSSTQEVENKEQTLVLGEEG
jgi:EAL domain-containing protein (putative c-di-GMP-specific phosphodiesterase class I)